MLILGDCIEKMRDMPENSIDAIVTDPPYGWRFMGKAWDGTDIIAKQKRNYSKTTFTEANGKVRTRSETSTPIAMAAGEYDLSLTGNQSFQLWTEDWAKEAFRVLKPGGHMLIFCGPRTYHRMASGVEDAGFEIRDQLQWLFGSGFPKSLNISKAIDKQAGVEREIIATIKKTPSAHSENMHEGYRRPWAENHPKTMDITSPATEAAKEWSGWGTALKPANEPIVLARKPLSEKTVAENVLRWGTGGLNIDGCRIGPPQNTKTKNASNKLNYGGTLEGGGAFGGWDGEYKIQNQGRFPANLILDETAAEMLDMQTGELESGAGQKNTRRSRGNTYGKPNRGNDKEFNFDSGGASRFFYVAKASRSERNRGLESRSPEVVSDGREKPIDNPYLRGETERLNTHPTVKPIRLMRYLCRLVTPPNGTVLDPFMGSGTTGIAAKEENFNFIGIELDKSYFDIAERRINIL